MDKKVVTKADVCKKIIMEINRIQELLELSKYYCNGVLLEEALNVFNPSFSKKAKEENEKIFKEELLPAYENVNEQHGIITIVNIPKLIRTLLSDYGNMSFPDGFFDEVDKFNADDNEDECSSCGNLEICKENFLNSDFSEIGTNCPCQDEEDNEDEENISDDDIRAYMMFCELVKYIASRG